MTPALPAQLMHLTRSEPHEDHLPVHAGDCREEGLRRTHSSADEKESTISGLRVPDVAARVRRSLWGDHFPIATPK